MITIEFTEAIEQIQFMIDEFVRSLPRLSVAFAVFLFFAAIAWITKKLVMHLPSQLRRREALALVLGRVTQWTILIIGVLVSAVVIFPNFSPAEFISLLGLGSVAIGFAFRDVLQNFLVGILLLLSEPFRIGDQITNEDYQGTVENINSRATTLRTYDGRRIVIPNIDLYSKSVTVHTAFERRRIEQEFIVSFDTDIDVVKALTVQAITGLDNRYILTGPSPDVIVLSLDTYGVRLRMRWWIQPPLYTNFVTTRDLVLIAVKNKLQDHNIRIQVPITQIRTQNQEVGLLDASR